MFLLPSPLPPPPRMIITGQPVRKKKTMFLTHTLTVPLPSTHTHSLERGKITYTCISTLAATDGRGATILENTPSSALHYLHEELLMIGAQPLSTLPLHQE